MTRAVAFSSLALFASLCAPALCGLVYTADDLGAFHLPLRDFYARALANGDSFDWCPQLFGGFYLTGEGQAGTYHPLHWGLYRWLPLAVAWNLECALSYSFMYAGVWLFMRRRGLGHACALFAAMTFAFCGFNLLHFVHVNAVAVVAHVPWLLYTIDRLTARRTDFQSIRPGAVHPSPFPEESRVASLVLLIATLTGSQLLLGYPQYVLYSLIAEGLFLAYAMRERHDTNSWHRAAAVTAPWALAKLLGLAVGTVQVLPTLEALADSARQNADASFAAWGSLHPLNAVQLIAPYLFATRVVGQNTHELGLYAGMAPLLLAVIAITNRRLLLNLANQRTIFRFALTLVLLGGLLALGGYGPLYRLVSALPLVGSFRFPCRATVLVQLGIGLLATVGCSLVYGGLFSDKQAVRNPRNTLTALLAGSTVLAGAAPVLWPDYVASPQLVWSGPLLLLLGLLLVYCSATGRRWALSVLVVFTAIDLGVYGLSYGVYRGATSLNDYVANAPAPTIENGARVALDVAPANGEGVRAGNQILLRGFSRIDGYAGLEPARRLDYRAVEALRLAGVTYVSPAAPVRDRWHLRENGNGWLEVPGSLPRARLKMPDFGAAVSASANPGDVEVIDDRPGRIVVIADTRNPAVVALTESYHRGWQAWSGGTRLPTQRVNGDFLACQVRAGRTTVEFCFAPASLRYGRAISICGLGFLGLLIALSRQSLSRRRARQSSGSQNFGEFSYPRDR